MRVRFGVWSVGILGERSRKVGETGLSILRFG